MLLVSEEVCFPPNRESLVGRDTALWGGDGVARAPFQTAGLRVRVRALGPTGPSLTLSWCTHSPF